MTDSTQTPRSAVVTGGNRGIGKAIADLLEADGHRVAILDMVVDDVPSTRLGIACDITDPAAVDAAFGQIEQANGPVEILVANAGITRDTLLMRMSDDDWDKVISVNLTGSFNCARRATRGMLKRRFGRLVFIGSVVGQIGGAGQVNYSSTKAGLVGMARSIARELGSRGITANVVAPGFIETHMTEVLPEEVRARYLAQIPLGKLGQVEDIARAVEFLTREDSGYITGALLPVDGGIGMGH